MVGTFPEAFPKDVLVGEGVGEAGSRGCGGHLPADGPFRRPEAVGRESEDLLEIFLAHPELGFTVLGTPEPRPGSRLVRGAGAIEDEGQERMIVGRCGDLHQTSLFQAPEER